MTKNIRITYFIGFLFAFLSTPSLSGDSESNNGMIDKSKEYNRALFKNMDKNQDGEISELERDLYNKELFEDMDKNKDGKISELEIDQYSKTLFRDMDRNKDGKISELEMDQVADDQAQKTEK
ncbi:hypothetical protein [Candidatus Nitrosacidococcus sp. I8]|uniref:hypothetical protein n=1 Tax=Candidatus Nitrosacidococcus sp. I8 TaxID=2942908 RepID=UPI002227EA7F|nr:hypothetical protein [Candidatus Nitrosacidococcus sp. I8]CAH9014233.1 hypothetical protein NURINAE_00036 [Candidatus Nitrosacidococcus sp. I8]